MTDLILILVTLLLISFIVILSILVIGPKDFPIVLRKVGGWVRSIKSYINKMQSSVTDLEEEIIESNDANDKGEKFKDISSKTKN